MAGTWPESLRRRRILRAIDAVGLAVARLWRRGAAAPSPPAAAGVQRILVIDLWRLGDIVLTSAALRAVRDAFPSARVTLLAQPHAEVLLAHTGLVDEIVPFVAPWTAEAAKYAPWRYDVPGIWRLLRDLRARKFDVSLDARADPRNNVLAFLARARRRVGFGHGGGSFLLTDVVEHDPSSTHKVEDWLAVVSHVAGRPVDAAPTLRVSAEERAWAAAALRTAGLADGERLVAVHAGAHLPVRRWAPSKFAAVAERLADRHGARVLVLVDPAGHGELPLSRPAIVMRPTLRQMLALLEQCAVLVCNDSGPMHMAAALGVPVVAAFTSQRPDWYGPRSGRSVARAVYVADMPCRPCFDRCRFPRPLCSDRLTADDVARAAEEALLAASGQPPVVAGSAGAAGP